MSTDLKAVREFALWISGERTFQAKGMRLVFPKNKEAGMGLESGG